MDGQEYLNQISQSNKQPATNGKFALNKEFFTSKIFIFLAVSLVLLILIIILGSVLGANKASEKDLAFNLKLHLTKTAEVIHEYQDSVKSSELRSSGASLYGLLTNTDKDITNYLVAEYKFKDKDISKSLDAQATETQAELSNELFEAKINGVLDRTFAHKMAYEILLFKSEETKLRNAAKGEDLKAALDKSITSLDNIYPKFNDFSEGK